MNLNDFVLAKPRPLPVFILADVSGSMKGEKIDTVNDSLKEMVSALKKLEDVRGEIHLCIITFGGTVQVAQPLVPVQEVEIPELEASGNTPLGDAIGLVNTMIGDKEIVPSRAFLPTVVLMSDGLPTDVPRDLYDKLEKGVATTKDVLSWRPMVEFHSSPRVNKCQRLALAIGQEARYPVMSAFLNRPDTPVVRTLSAEGILRFLRFVTVSVSSRSVSHNPDLSFSISLGDFDPSELEF